MGRVMHPCRQNAKQLESASFQRSVSPLILAPAERQSSTLILEKQLESVSFQTSGSILSLPPLGKINQVELKCSQVKPLSNDNEKILHNICKFLKTRNIDHVIFKKLAQGKDSCFFFDNNRKILFLISHKMMAKWLEVKYKNYSSNLIQRSRFTCMIVKPKMFTQGFLDPMFLIFSSVNNTTKFLSKVAKNYNNPQVMAWVLDVLTLTIEMNDPFFWRPISLLKFVARIYSTIMRLNDFKNNKSTNMLVQSLEDLTSIDSMLLMFACFGLPDTIMRGIKQISLFTNRKVLDSPNILMEMIERFLEVIYDMLTWLKTSLDLKIVSMLIDLFIRPLNFIKGIKLTKILSKITVDFQKNNQIIFDPTVKVSIKETYKAIKTNLYIQSLLINPTYKVYLQQYHTLEIMNKLACNFETSARNEPVCIVFEGKAGSGKSTIMNKVVDYLSKKSYSIYNHTCPTVDAGKDFYDDYLSQDIFVMDDVGQQGISQWRQIINFVSPVKFPLECANADLKNTKFFDSKVLLVTTNHFSDLRGFTKSDCIAEPEALFRRCHVLNFDECTFEYGIMKGNIKYKKYDFINHIWTTSFIGAQAGCNLPNECNVESSNKTVGWIYALTTYFLKKQEEMLTHNELSIDDTNEIDEIVDQLTGVSADTDTYIDALEGLQPQSSFSFLAELTENSLELFKEYFSFIKDQFIDTTLSVYENLRVNLDKGDMLSTILSGVLRGLGSTLISYAINKIFNFFVGNREVHTLSCNSYREESVKLWQKTHGEYIQRTVPMKVFDGTCSDTLDDIVTGPTDVNTRISSLRSRMRVIELISSNGYKNISQGIVSGRRLIVQCHSYSSLTGVANIYRDWQCFSNNSFECNNIPFKVIKEWPEYDMAIIEIQLTIPIYKDATHSLFSKELDEETQLKPRHLYFINAELALSLDNNFTVNVDSFQVQNPVLNKSYTVLSGAGINYSLSSSGLCGSLLVDSEYGLCGLHVAGNAQNGFAFVLPKRVLKELKNLLVYTSSKHLEIKNNTAVEYSGLKLFNDVFSSKRPIQNTSLTKSELHEELTVETEQFGEKLPPNFLSFGSKTLERIAEKSLKPIPYISQDAIEFAKKCIRQFMIPFSDLTDKETIKGIKDEDLSSLNKDSVNGFGYSKFKEDYLNFDTGEITLAFKNKIDSFTEKCKADSLEIDDLLFYEAFKDELRLKEKVKKPRSFRVAPLHHTFLVKKCLGKLFSHCKKNKWQNQMMIGMNPYKEWNRLYQKLKSCHINFDGDFGNWDGGAPAQIQDAVSEIITEFYQGEFKETLKILLDSMVRTFVLIKQKVVLTTHSMPSGCWVTAWFNSLINRMLTALVLFVEMTKDGKIPTVEDFNKIVDCVTGDDKVCGSPLELSKYFNAITMRDFAYSIGMKYTDGDKGEITETSKPVIDCVFLKRSFKWHSVMETVVGPLSLTTIANSLRYKDSRRDYDQIMSGKLTAFQFEIFLHENPELKEKVLSAAKQKSFFFQDFDDEHIMKTMSQDNTYEDIMCMLGKNISNFS